MAGFRTLLHQRIRDQLKALCRDHPQLASGLKAAARKLTEDPRGYGDAIRYLKDTHLQGNIFRLWVAGRRGRRLFYFVTPAETSVKLVVPLFLSPVPRSQFDYDNVDPDAIGADIVADYRAQNLDAFGLLDPAVVPECTL